MSHFLPASVSYGSCNGSTSETHSRAEYCGLDLLKSAFAPDMGSRMDQIDFNRRPSGSTVGAKDGKSEGMDVRMSVDVAPLCPPWIPCPLVVPSSLLVVDFRGISTPIRVAAAAVIARTKASIVRVRLEKFLGESFGDIDLAAESHT